VSVKREILSERKKVGKREGGLSAVPGKVYSRVLSLYEEKPQSVFLRLLTGRRFFVWRRFITNCARL